MTDNDNNQQPHTNSAPNSAPPICRLVGYFIRKLGERKAKKENEPAQDKAARRTATATRVIACFTVALCVVGWFQYQTLNKTDETLKAEQRPWMWFAQPIVTTPFVYTDSGATLGVRFDLVNSGHSPALNVEMDGRMIVLKSGLNILPNILSIQKMVCDGLRDRPTGEKGGGVTIFPGAPVFRQNVGFGVDKKQIDDGLKANSLPIPVIMPMIIGCLRYVFYADSSQHETRFVYMVQHTAPAALLRTDQGNIPQNEVSLLLEDFGNGSD